MKAIAVLFLPTKVEDIVMINALEELAEQENKDRQTILIHNHVPYRISEQKGGDLTPIVRAIDDFFPKQQNFWYEDAERSKKELAQHAADLKVEKVYILSDAVPSLDELSHLHKHNLQTELINLS